MIEWILLGAGTLFLLGRKKQTVAGIGKVTTPNPAVQFFQSGIKINGLMIPGYWNKDSGGVYYVRKDIGQKEDTILQQFFRISNYTDITEDYLDYTVIRFSTTSNTMYLSAAEKIYSEISDKKDRAFQKWLNEIDITISVFGGTRYANISKNGKELGIISENKYSFRIWSDKRNMEKLVYYVDKIGFDNAFAAYL